MVRMSLLIEEPLLVSLWITSVSLAGSPEVECAAEALTVRFKTEREFEGHVYVKVRALYD